MYICVCAFTRGLCKYTAFRFKVFPSGSRTLIRAFLPLFTIYDVLFWNGGQLRPRRRVGISFLSMVISAVEEKGGMLNPRCKEDDRSIQGDAML